LNPDTAGPWCAAVPLWSNPLLLDNGTTALQRSQLCPNLGDLACPAISTVGDLLRLRLDLESWTPVQYQQRRQFLKWPGQHGILSPITPTVAAAHRSLSDLKSFIDVAVHHVCLLLPEGWLEAAQSIPLLSPASTPPVILYNGDTIDMASASTTAAAIAETSSTAANVADLLISCLGWKLGRRTVNLASFRVKAGTILQLANRPAPQTARMSSFSVLVSPNAEPTPNAVQRMLSRMWSRPCDGRNLEVLWRLVLNGTPTVDNLPLFQSRQCGCGLAIGPTRIHLYHECAIVQPAWLAVQHQLCADFSIPTPGLLQRRHIWMGIRPHPRLHQGIWDIVAVKLLAAFEAGRRNWVDRVLKLQNTAAPATRGRGGRVEG
jgi:hypothetical protein